MMTAQQLKNSILQRAIEGKLVEQRAEEGTAKKLLKDIKLEKEKLVKEGKIKKSKPLPPITEDEIPFDIPDSWEWVRLNDVSISGLGKTLNKATDNGKIKPYLCSINIYWNGINFEKLKTAPFNDVEQEKYLLKKGDLLICEGGDAGRSAVWEYEQEMYYQNALHCVRFFQNISPYYFLMCLELYKNTGVIDKYCKGVTIKHLVQSSLKEILFPLPPLSEQHRIVAKIEEMLPLVDQYDKAYSQLTVLNEKFPQDMKKSILQYAIEGKLVEQRPEEGTAKELLKEIKLEQEKLVKEGKIKKSKSLPAITEDEIPFEIPDSWEWVRLGEIASKIGAGSTPSGGKAVYLDAGIKFIRSQNVYNDGLRMAGMAFISEEINNKKQGSIVQSKDILLNITGGSIGRCALVPDDFDIANINQHILIIRNINEMCRYYLHKVLISPYIQELIMSVQVGVSREGLSAEKTKNMLIPLPPLSEQHRIVAKIEELMPLCDKLSKTT